MLNSSYKTNTFISIVFLFFAQSPANSATLNVDNDFQSAQSNSFRCSGNCPTVAASSEASSKSSFNFDLSRTMATNFRTEATLGKRGIFAFNREYWLGFNYRYEDWAKDSNAEIAPFQIHARPSDWTKGCNLGSAVGTAPFLMLSENDEVRFYTYGGKIMWRAPIQKKQWQSLTVHFKISTGSDGFVEAWKDGVKLGRVDGANSPVLDKCGKPMREPYFKMGIYKWDWKRKSTQSSRRQLFIESPKIAEGSDAYSMVSSTPVKNDDGNTR